jgi:hypothetical protein
MKNVFLKCVFTLVPVEWHVHLLFYYYVVELIMPMECCIPTEWIERESRLALARKENNYRRQVDGRNYNLLGSVKRLEVAVEIGSFDSGAGVWRRPQLHRIRRHVEVLDATAHDEDEDEAEAEDSPRVACARYRPKYNY